jgi:hypothetical protein
MENIEKMLQNFKIFLRETRRIPKSQTPKGNSTTYRLNKEEKRWKQTTKFPRSRETTSEGSMLIVKSNMTE